MILKQVQGLHEQAAINAPKVCSACCQGITTAKSHVMLNITIMLMMNEPIEILDHKHLADKSILLLSRVTSWIIILEIERGGKLRLARISLIFSGIRSNKIISNIRVSNAKGFNLFVMFW